MRVTLVKVLPTVKTEVWQLPPHGVWGPFCIFFLITFAMNMFHMIENRDDSFYMRAAIEEAVRALGKDEVPVGAVVVAGGRVIARAHNLTETLKDPTAHAEMQAITSATNFLGGKYLTGCIMYVTVEPCPMCAGAINWSQVDTLVYGASDTKRGYLTVSPALLHPKTNVRKGILERECRELITGFFKKKRETETN